MIGFYYGTSIPGANAKEGIYFINDNSKYSIYIKRNNGSLVKYAETNELTSSNLDALWEQIGNTFVAKTFTVAGLSLNENITLSQMQEAFKEMDENDRIIIRGTGGTGKTLILYEQE